MRMIFYILMERVCVQAGSADQRQARDGAGGLALLSECNITCIYRTTSLGEIQILVRHYFDLHLYLVAK